MTLDLVLHPNDILYTKCDEINRELVLQEETQTLIKNMIETMNAAKGIGIAAPQIGNTIQLCIIGQGSAEHLTEDVVLINPTWEKLSKKTAWDVEGCLSIPNTFGKVKRYKDIGVTALNPAGEKIEFEAHDFFARVIQHEIDHLNGVLFIDKGKGIYTTEE